jgi:hypothetical protein
MYGLIRWANQYVPAVLVTPQYGKYPKAAGGPSVLDLGKGWSLYCLLKYSWTWRPTRFDEVGFLHSQRRARLGPFSTL